MSETIYDGLTQLGHAAPLPESPEAAVLERVPNPQQGIGYVVRFTAPEISETVNSGALSAAGARPSGSSKRSKGSDIGGLACEGRALTLERAGGKAKERGR